MTIAERIKNNTPPLSFDRRFMAYKQAIVKDATVYEGSVKTWAEKLRVSCWQFKFIDGSSIKTRNYH